MPLGDHLRELRNRLFKAVLAIVATTVVGWFIKDWAIAKLIDPPCHVSAIHGIGTPTEQCPNGLLTMGSVLQPLSFNLKVALILGVILAVPVWTYQVWGFLAPGLHKNEKKYAFGFTASAVPLFAAGAAIAYWLFPKMMQVLLGFTPGGISNQQPADEFLTLFMKIVFVFGLSFELPVLLVALNFIGVLPGRRLAGWWRGAIVIIFIFAAVATPTGDPLTMSALAVPICMLYGLAVGVALLNDRRKYRARAAEEDAQLDDDEVSSIDEYLNEEPEPGNTTVPAQADGSGGGAGGDGAPGGSAASDARRSRYQDDDIT